MSGKLDHRPFLFCASGTQDHLGLLVPSSFIGLRALIACDVMLIRGCCSDTGNNEWQVRPQPSVHFLAWVTCVFSMYISIHLYWTQSNDGHRSLVAAATVATMSGNFENSPHSPVSCLRKLWSPGCSIPSTCIGPRVVKSNHLVVAIANPAQLGCEILEKGLSYV